jgi:hypothetical protein
MIPTMPMISNDMARAIQDDVVGASTRAGFEPVVSATSTRKNTTPPVEPSRSCAHATHRDADVARSSGRSRRDLAACSRDRSREQSCSPTPNSGNRSVRAESSVNRDAAVRVKPARLFTRVISAFTRSAVRDGESGNQIQVELALCLTRFQTQFVRLLQMCSDRPARRIEMRLATRSRSRRIPTIEAGFERAWRKRGLRRST